MVHVTITKQYPGKRLKYISLEVPEDVFDWDTDWIPLDNFKPVHGVQLPSGMSDPLRAWMEANDVLNMEETDTPKEPFPLGFTVIVPSVATEKVLLTKSYCCQNKTYEVIDVPTELIRSEDRTKMSSQTETGVESLDCPYLRGFILDKDNSQGKSYDPVPDNVPLKVYELVC